MVVSERRPVGSGGSDTKQRILVIALELFARQGYAGTSIRDIAEHAGLTKAALYYHFTSKEQMLEAVTEPLAGEFRRIAERARGRPAPPPAELLAGLVDLLSRRAALIRTVMGDPSVPHHRHKPPALEEMGAIAAALAPDGSPTALLRARAALGAAQFGSFTTAMQRMAEDPAHSAPPDRSRAEALLCGGEHLLTEQERAEIVAAALRALDG